MKHFCQIRCRYKWHKLW